MIDSLVRLMDGADLMPHGICFAWRPDLVFLHAGSDLVITIAYLVIPVALVGLVRRRGDIKHGWMLYTFAAFILLCGLTHLSNIYVLWVPDFAVQGLVKLATAAVSIMTAVALWQLLPALLDIPTRRDLEAANASLKDEIARRRLVEAELKERTRELERSNAELDRFVSVASHDMRAPLRGIRNVVGWLEEDLGADVEGETAERMQLIKGRVARLERMLNDLLDYSRTGKEKHPTETFATEEVVRDWFEDLNGDGRFTLRIDSELPVLTTQRLLFEQVIANLLGNAMKHHDRDSGTIAVSCMSTDGMHRFTIDDDGPGIPEQYREKVFGVFQTIASRDTKEASGLGLSIVKKVVEAVGGAVMIAADKPTRGTRFEVLWPLNQAGREAA